MNPETETMKFSWQNPLNYLSKSKNWIKGQKERDSDEGDAGIGEGLKLLGLVRVGEGGGLDESECGVRELEAGIG